MIKHRIRPFSGLFRNTGRSHRSSGHLLTLLLTMSHKNNIRLFIGVTVFINAVLLHRSNRVLSASQY
ncbi:hypothetical protein LFZ48_21495 [Salmonella enterica subsp. salamae serovar 56:z10:e,n,x str. 1369-73]|nr:hypothetical protein LFZ48_21495 [Salmonella enterica subsp. salamae serovar 56:z10:e,n,x str. 1369-73]